ncbi:hypothetical protein C6A89_07725 [Klebsiella sp. CVUAS 10975.2]|nr:hypothetical protein [Klebsiella sp. CVUAS 10975.2]MBZ6755131.1 hypothetical protein [Klebsiella grimontii]MBZ7271732.1 hypothetical protein [Klebsiella grimontii]
MALRLPGLRVSSRLRRRRPGKTFTPRPGISGSAPEGGRSGSPDRRDAPPPGDFHAAADMSLKQRDMQRCPGPR